MEKVTGHTFGMHPYKDRLIVLDRRPVTVAFSLFLSFSYLRLPT